MLITYVMRSQGITSCLSIRYGLITRTEFSVFRSSMLASLSLGCGHTAATPFPPLHEVTATCLRFSRFMRFLRLFVFSGYVSGLKTSTTNREIRTGRVRDFTLSEVEWAKTAPLPVVRRRWYAASSTSCAGRMVAVNIRQSSSMAETLERLDQRIRGALRRAGRSDRVTLIGITKYVAVEPITEAYEAGLRHFGENRVQEFSEKSPRLALPEAVWHLVGHLQSNKARRAAELFHWVDSLDNPRLGRKLSAAAMEIGRELPVLVQVNVGDEAGKYGVYPGNLIPLIERVASLEGIAVRGLMAIPPFLEPAEQVRPFFRRLRELAEDLDRRRIPGVEMKELSMGMSHDFEVAIEEGATQVRVGTAIFGERPAG